MTALAIPNSLTPNDLERRKNYLTATDAPALMGSSPWKTKFDVFIEKTMEVEPLESTPAMFWGNLLEDDIIFFAEMELRNYLGDPNLKATRRGIRRVAPNGIMAATLDSLLEGRDEAIEAKTHASNHPNVNLEDWGDPWSDEVPQGYRDQCLAQMICAPELLRVWLVLSVGKAVPVIYCIERADHRDRMDEIEHVCCDFWDHHILTGTPPEDSKPTLATVKRVIAEVNETQVVSISDHLLERRKKLASLGTRVEKAKEALDGEIRGMLIGAVQGRSPKGHSVTLKTVNRKAYSVEALSYTRMDVKLARTSL